MYGYILALNNLIQLNRHPVPLPRSLSIKPRVYYTNAFSRHNHFLLSRNLSPTHKPNILSFDLDNCTHKPWKQEVKIKRENISHWYTQLSLPSTQSALSQWWVSIALSSDGIQMTIFQPWMRWWPFRGKSGLCGCKSRNEGKRPEVSSSPLGKKKTSTEQKREERRESASQPA